MTGSESPCFDTTHALTVPQQRTILYVEKFRTTHDLLRINGLMNKTDGTYHNFDRNLFPGKERYSSSTVSLMKL